MCKPENTPERRIFKDEIVALWKMEKWQNEIRAEPESALRRLGFGVRAHGVRTPGGSIALRLENSLSGRQPFKGT